MTTVTERQASEAVAGAGSGARRPLGVIAAIASIGLAGYAVTLAPSGERAAELIRAAVIILWATCGASLVARRPNEPIGFIVVAGSLLAGIGSVGSVVAADLARDDTMRTIGSAARWLALALLPGLGLHMVLGVPDGTIPKKGMRVALGIWYAATTALGLVLWAARPSPAWPIALASAVAVTWAAFGTAARYRKAKGLQRQRMQWFGWAVSVGIVVVLVLTAVGALAEWEHLTAIVAALATAPIPLALALGASLRLVSRVDRLLAHTVSLAGLSGLVVGVYIVIVIGLGRVPKGPEKTLFILSMAAAAVAALLYVPTRDRLAAVANKIVYGERHAPDEVLRTFGSRMSRAIALDELLLQMAESLRKTFALDAVEVWTGQGGLIERTVSDPERGHARMTIGPKEQPVVARAGVSGPAWIKVWLPQIIEKRADSMVRMAPIVHSGELLGLIIVERYANDEPLGEENERVLTELARQVGLALHNAQLDSALQDTLDEVRRQAEDLRLSRQRIVASADAARRKIERDLHDGAQQNLVALAVKVRLLSNLVERDPTVAKTMVQELAGEVQEAVQALRDFAHGIYPPVLVDHGLMPALESAAGKAPLPTSVTKEDGIGRYPQEVEAAIYFCCLEALNNAGKHAGEGAGATIRVWKDASALLFEVADDGAGFDKASKGLGAGFVNMADRLGAIGGTLSVDSAPGAGTRITGRVPLG